MKPKSGFLLLLLFLATPARCTASQETLLLLQTWGGGRGEEGTGVAVDASGNIAVTGDTASFGAGNRDIFVLKFDSSGNLLWQRTWGSIDDEWGAKVALDSQGNIYVLGFAMRRGLMGSEPFLLKFDSSGNLLWQITWQGSEFALVQDIAVSILGDIYITGATGDASTGDLDAYLLKLYSSGALISQMIWGTPFADLAYSLALAPSGDMYITGMMEVDRDYSSHSVWDAFLLKADSAGSLVWQRRWGSEEQECGSSVATDSSGGVYLTGVTEGFGAGSGDVFIVKFGSTGNLVWQRVWGGKNSHDAGYDVTVGSAEDVFVTGVVDRFSAEGSDAFLLKLDSGGRLVWQNVFASNGSDWGYDVAAGASGGVFATGYVSGPPPYSFNSSSFPLGTPTFNVTVPAFFAVEAADFTLSSPNGTVGYPSGNSTYSGGSAAFLLQYGPPAERPVFHVAAIALSMMTAVSVQRAMTRRRARKPQPQSN